MTGILTATGVGYLLIERAAQFGVGRARRRLEESARRVHGPHLPETRFFVHLSGRDLDTPLLRRSENPGWLFFYDNRLEFVGERVLVAVPRAQVAHLEPPTDEERSGGPGKRWLTVTLRGEAGEVSLHLQSRDGDGLSATAQDTQRLQAALEAWLAAP